MATKKNDEAVEKQTLSLDEAQEAIAKMLAEAQAKAEAIVADAQARVKACVSNEDEEKKISRKKAKEENLARGEELVEIKLFKDNGRYKDDVFVSCNGETCAIKRGVRVKVKRKFVEILENSENQDFETDEMIKAMDGKSEKIADL